LNSNGKEENQIKRFPLNSMNDCVNTLYLPILVQEDGISSSAGSLGLQQAMKASF
jgi:hypothetical protein